MLIALDTEFTSFQEPLILSIGLVCENGEEFYGELSPDSQQGQARLIQSSDFVKEIVSSQFGRFQNASYESESSLIIAASAWLEVRARCGATHIVFDSEHDRELLVSAMYSATPDWANSAVGQLAWANVADAAAVAVAAEAYETELSKRAQSQGISAHHALADAAALLAACRRLARNT